MVRPGVARPVTQSAPLAGLLPPAQAFLGWDVQAAAGRGAGHLLVNQSVLGELTSSAQFKPVLLLPVGDNASSSEPRQLPGRGEVPEASPERRRNKFCARADLRAEPIPRAGLHVQARAHARGTVRLAPAGAATGSCTARSGWRSRRRTPTSWPTISPTTTDVATISSLMTLPPFHDAPALPPPGPLARTEDEDYRRAVGCQEQTSPDRSRRLCPRGDTPR